MLWRFAWAMTRHPIVILVPALVLAIFYGAGKAFGLPRLFWNERAWVRFVSGAAMTLLYADALLVAYLLNGAYAAENRLSFFQFALNGAGLWLVVVLPRLVLQQVRYLRSSHRAGHGIGGRTGIAPAIRTVGGDGVSSRAAFQVPAWSLAAGIAMGALIATALAFLARSQLAASLLDWLYFRAAELRSAGDAPWLHRLALISFALLFVLFLMLRNRAPPAVGLCFLLAIGLAFYTAVEFWFQHAGLGLLLLLVLLWSAGWLQYKLRIPALKALYVSPATYPPDQASKGTSPATPLPLAFDIAVAPGEAEPSRRRLILVCASGGGIRAATWTAAILGRLDELGGFRNAARLVTGASGGMMGAASWLALTASRNKPAAIPAPRDSWPLLMNAVAMDSLTPVARDLVFHDIPLALLRRNNLRDRGWALENVWCDNLKTELGIDLRISLASLRNGEAAGQWPSLVLSPMIVEDGRRLLITNLDLTDAADHYVRWLSSEEEGASPSRGRASRTAYQLWQLWPDGWSEFPLSTAARLSAAFPYVSGAVLLPTTPRRRVVDAGYFDNYGLELAGNWLRELFEQRLDVLKKHVSGILVIQIRDNVSELSVSPESDSRKRSFREPRARRGSPLLRALEGLTSPPNGLLTARDSVMLFRNDSLLENLSQLYSREFSEDFLATTVFEFLGEASLSWHLAPDEVQLLEAQAKSPGIQLKLDAIEHWLNGRGYWAQPADMRPSSSP